jgi:hypothetical protein
MRLIALGARFGRRRSVLAASGDAGRALARCIVDLARGSLPGPEDYEAMMPPVAVYSVRRVPGANLWIWFSFDDERVYLVNLSASPPVPLK